MKKLIMFYSCLLGFLLVLNQAESEPLPPTLPSITPEVQVERPATTTVIKTPTINDYIIQYSKEFNIPSKWLHNLAKCESSYNPKVYGDGGNAYGLFQYWKPTWKSFTSQYGEPLSRDSAKDQIELTAWALSKGYGSHWTCDYKTGFVRTDL
jgi:soluble lytic murein transglycosylase-like protein